MEMLRSKLGGIGMIINVEFVDKEFNHNEDYNIMLELTNNTIILCDNPKIKNKLYSEFGKIWTGKCEEEGTNIYCNSLDDTDRGIPQLTKVHISYLPTTIVEIDGEQTITFTVELPHILQAKIAEDIWLAVENADETISVYPMTIFKGYQDIWKKGIYEVYKYIAAGRYGGCFAYENYPVEFETWCMGKTKKEDFNE